MKKFFVLSTAIALISTSSIFAAAEDITWNFYGTARVGTWYMDSSDDWVPAGWAYGDADTADFDMYIQGNSHVGANVKMNDIGGQFEFGAGGGDVALRILCGTYDIGDGQLLIGQTYTPVNTFGSNQVFNVDTDLLDTGFVYGDRYPMIQFSHSGFKVALIKPKETGSGIENSLPKIEASYNLTSDIFSMLGYAGYQTYRATITDDLGNVTFDDDINSMVVGAMLTLKLGPATINTNATYETNGAEYGLASQVNNSYDTTTNEDAKVLRIGSAANFTAGEKFIPEVGVGYIQNDDSDQEAINYYANVTINVAKNFIIVPEIGVTDLDSSGDQFYSGAKWQMSF